MLEFVCPFQDARGELPRAPVRIELGPPIPLFNHSFVGATPQLAWAETRSTLKARNSSKNCLLRGSHLPLSLHSVSMLLMPQ